MSEQERKPHEACDHYAPLLAMLNDLPEPSETFSVSERAAAREHLAGCARCQADQRAYARLAGDLRRVYRQATASPLRTSDLLAAIGATREPEAPAHTTSRPRRNPIRSVIYLGDFDGGFDRMSEHDERDDGRDNGAQAPSAGRKMAAIPSLRPGPRERIAARQRWAAAFGATAAALALVVVAVTLFATRARPTTTQTAHPSAAATQTVVAHTSPSAANLGAVVSVSMVSPTDGWALGDATGQRSGTVQNSIALYHYDGSQWTLKQQVSDFPIYGGNNSPASLTMLSATDGWAFDEPGHLLHYDGTAWRPSAFTTAGSQRILQVLALDMVSPNEGWAAALLGSNSPQATLGFLRYDGQRWTVEPDIISLPGLDMNMMTISGISVAPGGDVWAAGWAGEMVTQGTETPVGLIFRRVDGVWRLTNKLNQPDAAVQIVPRDILMLGPDNGWIVGDTDQTTTATEIGGATTSMTTTHALLLHYDGARWTQVPAPLASPTGSDHLQGITATGPESLWVTVQTNAGTISPNGVAISGEFLHYDGKVWSEVTPSLTPKGVTSVWLTNASPALDGTLWAVGGTEMVQNQQGSVGPFFCLFANGAWSVVTPIVS